MATAVSDSVFALAVNVLLLVVLLSPTLLVLTQNTEPGRRLELPYKKLTFDYTLTTHEEDHRLCPASDVRKRTGLENFGSERLSFKELNLASLPFKPGATGREPRARKHIVTSRRKLTGREFRNSQKTDMSTHDRDVLLEVRDALVQYSMQHLLPSWNATGNPSVCSGWEGVKCNKAKRVVALSLSRKNLNGTISPAMGNLSFLTSLDLSSNFLHGTIPSSLSLCRSLISINLSGGNSRLWFVRGLFGPIPFQLGTLSNLEELSLSDNSLNGTIPQNLGNCTNLRILDLSNNGNVVVSGVGQDLIESDSYDYLGGLFGHIPFQLGALSNLERLILARNNLSGAVPQSLGNCTNLKELDFSSNHLTGNIPPALGGLTNLTSLALRHNDLTGNIPLELGGLTNLSVLDLSNNDLTGSVPPQLGLTNLTWMYLDDNHLTGPIPPELGGLRNLDTLYLYGNNFSGSIPTELGALTTLHFLDLSYNNLTGNIPRELLGLSRLNLVSLSNNLLTGNIPSLANMTHLEWFSVDSNNLDGGIPGLPTSLSFLVLLDLSDNNLNGTIPPEVGDVNQLEVLSLFNNHLTGNIPPSLGNVPQLEWLLLHSNNLTGVVPGALGNCVQLNVFSASGNQLTGVIPEFPNSVFLSLQVLDLGSNNLEGEVPSWIWALPNLQVLDLSKNSLSGTIPDSWTGLGGMQRVVNRSSHANQTLGDALIIDITFRGRESSFPSVSPTLTSLDLSHNLLTGEIPSQLGSLVGLVNLNLSHNMFTGSLNNTLGSISALEALDVSFNNLSGPIPSTLPDLGILELGANNFSGPIPSRTKYPSQSYLPDNVGLCGSPLPRQCSGIQPSNIMPPISTKQSRRGMGFSDVFSIAAFEIGVATGFASTLGFFVLSRQARLAFFRLLKLDMRSSETRNPQYNRVYGVFQEKVWS